MPHSFLLFNTFLYHFTFPGFPFILILTKVGDLKIGRRIINKVIFVDDMAIMAKTQEKLQDMGNRLVDTGSVGWKSTLTNKK